MHQVRGFSPTQDWKFDFTHMPWVWKLIYLLVWIDTFTRWVESFPSSSEKPSAFSHLFSPDWYDPPFGLLASIQSENIPVFISQITQEVSKLLGTQWNLHISCPPQSLGKVEKANSLLKAPLSKLMLQLHKGWDSLLPNALLIFLSVPREPIGYSLSELLDRCTFLPGPNLSPETALLEITSQFYNRSERK